MKSDMKKNLSRLVALGLVLVLGACVKDDPTGPGGPFQSKSVGAGGDHGGDDTVFQLSPSLRVDERLEIGAASGHQHGDSCHSDTSQSFRRRRK